MSSMQQTLRDSAQQFNLYLTEAQLSSFIQYSRELIAWNQRVNLTRIVEPEEIVIKHFLDSLSVFLALPKSFFSVVDVGSGAGFPGLPLKIACPDIQLTLIEAAAKKTDFLQHLVDTLKLTDVVVVHARAEEIGRQPSHRQRYEVAVARAVSTLSVLAEYMLPLVKVGGLIIVQKGRHVAEEVEAANRALGLLGGQVEQILSVTVPGLDAARHLVVIEKIKATREQYPRRPGLPAKRPL